MRAPSNFSASAAARLAVFRPGRALLITSDFTVTATSGPLKGDVSTGSFTFNSSIIPAGGGVVLDCGLFTDLSFTWDGIAYAASVPEPGKLSLLGLGLVGVGFMRRRNKKLTAP